MSVVLALTVYPFQILRVISSETSVPFDMLPLTIAKS